MLARATDPVLHEVGQDGGLVSAILLYALENDIIDAALVSYLEGDGSTWKAVPGVARTKEDIIASAGSRYTYSANTMAYDDAIESGAERIALVGMSCQSSVPPVMNQRKAGKVGRRLALNIGLLCSKTFDDAIFEELLEAKYGLKRAEIKKMNIKGRLQIWMHDGRYVEVPLKECHASHARAARCAPTSPPSTPTSRPAASARSTTGRSRVVRTDAGREVMEGLERDGWIEVRGGDEDLGAIELMHKLAKKQRARWPEFATHRRAPRLRRQPNRQVPELVARRRQELPMTGRRTHVRVPVRAGTSPRRRRVRRRSRRSSGIVLLAAATVALVVGERPGALATPSSGTTTSRSASATLSHHRTTSGTGSTTGS